MRKSRGYSRRFLNRVDMAGAAFLCPAFFFEIVVTSSPHETSLPASDDFSLGPEAKSNLDFVFWILTFMEPSL